MKQQPGESLSALLDDEADELDLQRILNALAEGEDVAETWRRYHLVSAAARHELDEFAQVDLTHRLRDALATETAPLGRQWRLGQAFWLRPVASIAVAASVTAAILSSAQLYHLAAGESVPDTAMLASNGDVSGVLAVRQAVGIGGGNGLVNASISSGSVVEHRAADAMAQRRLEVYLQSHLENASLNTNGGMLPFARAAIVAGEQ